MAHRRDKWQGLPGKRGISGDVNAELRFHLEERIEELVASGMSRAEAEQEAKARFGDVPAIGAEVARIERRRVRGRSLRESTDALARDIRYAVRALRARPGFTLVAVLTLGLGIGANTAVFSAVNGVLLHPFATPELNRLVVIRQDVPGLKLLDGQLTPMQAEFMAGHRELFAAFTGVTGASFNLTGSGEPQRITGVRTVGRFFEVFGVRPAAGRFYRAEDGENGNARVAVLSHAFWQSWAGGDAGAVGRSIQLNGVSYQIVGVLPADFRYRRTAQVFTPQVISDEMRQRGPWMFTAIGRLQPGINHDQLQARVAGLTQEWQADASRRFAPEMHFAFTGARLTDVMAGDLKPLLQLRMVAVGLVLLIACANVANLQLVRAAVRSRELAVRTAIGAGRWPIMRQLIAENALLAGSGGALGVGLGLLAVRALSSVEAAQYPALKELRLDAPVLGFTALVTFLAVLVSGLIPTIRASRADTQHALRDASKGTAGPGRNRLLRTSAALQVALSLMLLLGAGLLIRSLVQLLGTDPGFQSRNVQTFRVTLPSASYQQDDARAGFFERLEGSLAGLPNVAAVGAISDLPFGEGRNSSPFRIEGKPVGPDEPQRHADMRFVEGDYFKTLGIPLLRGRTFLPSDRKGAPVVTVIDESLARQYFGAEDPIGRTINQGPSSTIIGVVGAIKHGDLTEPDKPTIYYSYQQAPWYSGLYLTIRTSEPADALMRLVKARLGELDPNLPVYDVEPMQARVDASLGTRRLAMVVLTGFAGLALVLALLGVYGVLSYSTSRRTHELGIRMALGALRGDVIRMVLRTGLTVAGAGLVVGLTGFLILSRLLASILYGVTAHDPLTIAVGVGILILGSALAAWVPARRAAAVDPVVALREE